MKANIIKVYNVNIEEEISSSVDNMHKDKHFLTFLKNAMNNNHTIQVQYLLVHDDKVINKYDMQTIKY